MYHPPEFLAPLPQLNGPHAALIVQKLIAGSVLIAARLPDKTHQLEEILAVQLPADGAKCDTPGCHADRLHRDRREENIFDEDADVGELGRQGESDTGFAVLEKDLQDGRRSLDEDIGRELFNGLEVIVVPD